MSNLLKADFFRLRKNKFFIAGAAFMLILGVAFGIFSYIGQRETGADASPDDMFFTGCSVIGILIAVLCSLFTGTEFSDLTMRNKLIVGNSRMSVYLSNLFICCAAGIIMMLAHLAANAAVSIPLLGGFKMSAGKLIGSVVTILLMCASFSAVFTLITMTSRNKATAAVICIVGFVVLFLASVYINAQLQEPKIYDSFTYTDELGNIITEPAMTNPNYLDGTARTVSEFLLSFLPTGQALQFASSTVKSLSLLSVYSLLMIFITTATGTVCFKRSNLK